MTYNIDTGGMLLLLRKSGWNATTCPITQEKSCGDWCALFGEPRTTSSMTTTLDLCHRTLTCPTPNFQDLRQPPKE